jgi:sensor histidine kinase YesM
MSLVDPDRRPARWRRAFAGLTPRVVALVAALMLARTLSTAFDRVWLFERKDEWLSAMWSGFVQLLVMAAPMLIVIFATANMGPQRGPKRIVALTAAVILSTGIGTLLRLLVIGHGYEWGFITSFVPYVWSRYALLAGLLTAVGEFFRREAASIDAAQRAEIDHVAFEREMTEARLQVLQAQIEPHFLFNTLANVRRLYEQDRAAGRTMLDNLMRYLEIALPRMRHSESTLERDAEMVEAYLHIQQIRMGPRLAFSIDIPADLRAHRVPPMMLLTLVENAVKHGINPLRKGGRIHVTARADGSRLNLRVADTGAGFAPGAGGGTGLANVCARLAAQFGNRASFALENNDLGGATAIIALPLIGVAKTT